MSATLDPGNIIRCLNCNFETYDITVDNCPQCGMVVAVLYIGTEHGEGCRECTQVKPRMLSGAEAETFGVTDERLGFFLFNVSDARACLAQIPAAKREELKEEVPRDFIAQLLYVNVTEPRHYEHIPADKLEEPGILCALELGNGYRTFVLMDGSHRAGQKMMAHKPFYAYVLSDQMSRMFLMAHSPGSIVNEPPVEVA